MDELEINIDLIAKYLTGEASPEEAVAIDNWRTGSAEASKEFYEIASAWHKINNESIYKPIQSSIAWKDFQQQIISSNAQTKRINLFSRFNIAASVLLIGAISIITYFIINKNKKIIANDEENIVVTYDSSQLKLPDNSIVTLSKGSSFKYNKSAFNSKREVNLQGNAKFSVTHINGIPFIVNTNEIGIKVVGTIFNISNNDSEATVKVERGIVLVYHQKDTLTVKAEDAVSFNKQTKKLTYIKDAIATNSATLIFNDVPMSEVKKELENSYKINVVFDNDLLNECRISTQFQNKPLKYVLDIISTSLGIQYEQKNNTVYFYGHACN